MDNRISYLLLAIILLSGIVLSYLLYSGPFYSFDDLTYITYSHQLLSGTFSPVQSPYAYGFLLPLSIATSFAVFGANTIASILPSIIAYIAIILLCFAISRKLYGNNAGLVSAFFVATAPFVVGYSTRVLPDMGVGALVGVSILSLVYAQESDNSKIFYFLSGAFAAMTIYVKLIGLAYILSFIIAILIYRFYNKKRPVLRKDTNNTPLYSFAGLFIVAIAYIFIMFAFSGSLFATFIKYGTNQMTISPSSINQNINSLSTILFGYKGFGAVLDPQVFPLGLIIFVALAGTIIGIMKREKKIICISTILWIALLYLFFGTVTLTRYSSIFVVSRYFIMISAPIAIIASYALLAIYEISKPVLRRNSIYLPAFIAVIVIFSYIPIYTTLYNYNISISGDARVFSSMLNYVKAQPHGDNLNLITIDNQTSNFLQFLSAYNKTVGTYTLNTSNKVKISAQLNSICAPPSANTYIIIAYDNYSKLQSTTIFNDWINTSCGLVKVKSFNDNKPSSSVYNGMNVYIDLYKVS